MRGARWAALILLVVAAGALLVLPDLLRGSRETQIEPVRIEPPPRIEGARDRDRGDRLDERRGRDRAREPEPSTADGPPAAEQPASAPEAAPVAPAPAPAPTEPPASAGDDGGDGGGEANGGGGGGGSGQGPAPAPAEPVPQPPAAAPPPSAPAPVEDDDDDDVDGDDSVSEGGDD